MQRGGMPDTRSWYAEGELLFAALCSERAGPFSNMENVSDTCVVVFDNAQMTAADAVDGVPRPTGKMSVMSSPPGRINLLQAFAQSGLFSGTNEHMNLHPATRLFARVFSTGCWAGTFSHHPPCLDYSCSLEKPQWFQRTVPQQT